jgi:hypothetical protein
MMKHLAMLAVLALACAGLTGCLRAPVIPPMGCIYSDFKAPLDIDYDKSQVTGKSGSAESISILGLVAIGDCSAATAAKTGGIQTIDHADYTYQNILGVIQRYNTVVYGQ